MANSMIRSPSIHHFYRIFYALGFFLLGTHGIQAKSESYEVDPAHSSVEFRVRHFFTNVAGRFDRFSGTIQFDSEAPEKSKIQAVVETSSMNTNQSNRDQHLRTTDYFDVEKYPKMTFESKSWKKLGDAQYEVMGDITLRGVTKPVVLIVNSLGFGTGMQNTSISGWSATGKIKRSNFGMTSGAPAVGDEVAIEINVEAKKSSPN